MHGDPALARATLGDWVPTFALSTEGVLFALAFAVVIWLLFHALWQAVALGGRRLTSRRNPMADTGQITRIRRRALR